MKRHLLPALAAAVCLLGLLPASLRAQSAVPGQITYQGKVSDAAGNLIGAGTPVNRKVRFRIYNDPTSVLAANRLHSEEQTVTIANGEFNVLLGFSNATPVAGETFAASLDTVFNGAARYLGVTVDGGSGTFSGDPEISPRQQILTTPYAFRAKLAEGVANQSVTAAMIANNTITGSQVAAASITGTQLAGLTVAAANLADGSVTSAKILDGAVAAADLADGAVTLAKHAANSVDGSKVVDGSLAAADLADNAVTLAKHAANSVDGSKVVDGSLGTADLADGAVATAKVADAAVTLAKLAANAVDGAKIADGAVATADLADSAVTGVKIAAASVTAAKLASDVGGANGAYNYLRINGGNTSGYLFGAFNQLGDGVHLTYNNFNNNSAWSVGTTAGGQSRVSLGYGTITLATAPIGGTPAGGSSRLEIAADGRVGFAGTNGDANVQVLVNNTSGRIYPFAIATSAGGWFYFEHNGNAYKAGGGSWASSSDLRLKTDIRPVAGSLDRLLQLRSVHFRFKDQAKYSPGPQTGFIAQEMEQVFPEWVSTGPDGMKAIGFSGFESHAVQALRELRAEKDAQLAQRDAAIAALEQRIRDLETQTAARLAAFERRLNAASLSANSPR